MSKTTEHPTSNPPGGGRWRWDARSATWQSLDAAPAPAVETPPDATEAPVIQDFQE